MKNKHTIPPSQQQFRCLFCGERTHFLDHLTGKPVCPQCFEEMRDVRTPYLLYGVMKFWANRTFEPHP